MTKKEAELIIEYLTLKGFIHKDFREGHSDWDETIELIAKGKITEKFIHDFIYWWK